MLPPARCFLSRPLLPHVRLSSNAASTLRGGRNLTERYRTLERTTAANSKHVRLVTQSPMSAVDAQSDAPVPSKTTTAIKTIAGFVIPEEPRAPADDECCMSGCAVCVYDLYEEAFVAYKDSVATLHAALTALHIPEGQWPANIRRETQRSPTTVEKSKDAVLSAFEEMERALGEKRSKRAAVEADKRARGDVLVGDGEQAGLDLRGVYEGIRWIMFPNR